MKNLMRSSLASAAFALGLGAFAQAQNPSAPGTLNADQRELRAIYQELVEINTTDSVGSCTAAAEATAMTNAACGAWSESPAARRA